MLIRKEAAEQPQTTGDRNCCCDNIAPHLQIKCCCYQVFIEPELLHVLPSKFSQKVPPKALILKSKYHHEKTHSTRVKVQ